MARRTRTERIQHYQNIAKSYGFVLLEECLGYTNSVLMECIKHEKYKVKITLKGLKKHHFCPYCALENPDGKKHRTPFDVIQQEFENVGYTLLTAQKDYKNSIQKLNYLCPKHGEQQISYGHLKEGKRCRFCSKEKVRQKALLKTDLVERELQERHFIWLDKNYQGSAVPLKLSCKFHPDKIFYITYTHATKAHTKCPFCTSISRGEKEVYRILEKCHVDFVFQQRMKDLYRYKGQYFSYDFYIPSQNLLIEYQGEYHQKVTSFNTKERLADQQERDRLKREYAKTNGYRLLEIWYKDINKIESILLKEGVIECG